MKSVTVQIALAVVLGIALGLLFPDHQLKPFAEAGKLIIHWVKLVAGPFLFVSVVAAVVEVSLTFHHGVKVVSIALFNTAIAIAIGMGLAAAFLGDIDIASLPKGLEATRAPEIQLSLAAWLKTFMPASLFTPFVQNEILLIAVLALLTGLAMRRAHPSTGTKPWHDAQAVLSVFLQWLIAIIPLAVLSVVAGSVSEHGFGVFASLFKYVGVVMLGFVLQVVVVYGTWIFAVARLSPRQFWAHARAPIFYAFGVNSSLATLPLTMKALKDLGVSARSASLGAGVATNLNNDGIVLYEAMAVYFVAQLNHTPLDGAQMLAAALACMVASMGITGIPEAGFISLSVVVSTLGLPAEALPLLLAVDWALARLRSVVNVISDMTLAIALDVSEGKGATGSK